MAHREHDAAICSPRPGTIRAAVELLALPDAPSSLRSGTYFGTEASERGALEVSSGR
jgi:hypothetical protein